MRFEVQRHKGGEYRWRLLNKQGALVAVGVVSYASEEDCEAALKRLQVDLIPAWPVNGMPENDDES